jgi:hypothetical protein
MQSLKAQRNMHFIAPHLKTLGATSTDLSVPGWIFNVRNSQNLLDRVRDSEPPSDAVFVFEFFATTACISNRRTEVILFP